MPKIKYNIWKGESIAMELRRTHSFGPLPSQVVIPISILKWWEVFFTHMEGFPKMHILFKLLFKFYSPLKNTSFAMVF